MYGYYYKSDINYSERKLENYLKIKFIYCFSENNFASAH